MMNNNAWLGCFPIDLCLLSSPSFVKLSLTMAAYTELFLPFPFVLTVYTNTLSYAVCVCVCVFDHYAHFTHKLQNLSN